MAESTINGVRHRLKELEVALSMKFGGNILEVWFQDKFSREKVKLSERSDKLSKMHY